MDEDTKQFALFASMLWALILGGIGTVISIGMLVYAVTVASVPLGVASLFGLVISVLLAAMAYTWFVR